VTAADPKAASARQDRRAAPVDERHGIAGPAQAGEAKEIVQSQNPHIITSNKQLTNIESLF